MLTEKDKLKLRHGRTLSMRLVGRAMQVDAKTAKALLARHNALNADGKTTRKLLKEAFPEIYTEIEDEMYAADVDIFEDL